MKKPLSDKQLAANRANAARSTGPRSAEGKARSAQNARKHVFQATAFPIVRIEEIEDVARLREDAIHVYQPVNSQELFAIERIALAQQALLRAERILSGTFTRCANVVITEDGRPMVGINAALVDNDNQIVKAQNRNFLLAEGIASIVRSSPAFTLALRLQAQSERMYRRAVEEFERLRKLRPVLPNEPIFETELETKQSTCSPGSEKTEQTNPSPAPLHPPEHYGPDGELLFPYDRLDYRPTEPRT